MPSLQQISFKDWPSPDIARSMTGPDILHKHSINSLLEHNDIINRGGLSSPIEGMSSFDTFSMNSSIDTFSPLTSSPIMNSNSNPFNFSNLSISNPNLNTSNDSSQMALSPNMFMQSAKTYDDFRFDNDLAMGTSHNSNGGGNTGNSLKLLQRNFSYDSSVATTPSTPSSLGPKTFRGSPQFSDNSSNNDTGTTLFGSPSSRSNSPPDQSSDLNLFEGSNFLDMLNYLTINNQQSTNQSYHHQQSAASSFSNASSSDIELLQNIQTLNTLRLFQQNQMIQQNQMMQQFANQISNGNFFQSSNNNGYDMAFAGESRANQHQHHHHHNTNHHSHHHSQNQTKNWQLQPQSTGGNDANLDRIARFHRSSAALYDATCTWSGVLPPRSSRLVTYSCKIFLGGMPWDISEQTLVQIFKPFGQIKVEWPGKEQQASQPKGYVYIIFENDKQVKSLLQACTYTDVSSPYNSNRSLCSSSSAGFDDSPNPNRSLPGPGCRINFKISSKRIKSKDVEVIPWNIADSNYVKSASQKLDPTKTVFVGALHGQLTAEGLAKIMNDLFDGVVYVGIDTDKYKYPLGSARVTFNNSRSYMKAVVAAFIEIKTSKFTKKLQVDPYLEDSLCSMCGVQHGPYFCREIVCFRYFCRTCWQFQHTRDSSLQNHKPLTRNSKSTTIIGVGPQASGGGSNNNNQTNNNQPKTSMPTTDGASADLQSPTSSSTTTQNH